MSKKQKIRELQAQINHHNRMIMALCDYLKVDVKYRPCDCGESSLPVFVERKQVISGEKVS